LWSAVLPDASWTTFRVESNGLRMGLMCLGLPEILMVRPSPECVSWRAFHVPIDAFIERLRKSCRVLSLWRDGQRRD